MLRRVRVDGASVSQAARDFGFSRTAFYRALAALEEQGLPGLIPGRLGPKQAHKLNDAVLEFLERQRQGPREAPRADVLAEMVLKEFNLSVHPRSIERALAKRKKTALGALLSSPVWSMAVQPQEWTDRYEAARRQAVQPQCPLESGWELALLIRRGVVAWMRAWPAPKERQTPHYHVGSLADDSFSTGVTISPSLVRAGHLVTGEHDSAATILPVGSGLLNGEDS